MSFSDDFYKELNKKKKKKQEEENNAKKSGTSHKNDFDSEFYNEIGENYSPIKNFTSVYDDDIAPVKTESEERTWLKKSEGDTWQTILGSMTDIGEHIGAGFMGIGEKIVDAGLTLGTMMNQSSMMKAAETEMMVNAMSGKSTKGVLDRYQKAQDEAEKETAEFVAKDLYDEEAVAKKLISDNAMKIGIDSERHSVFGEKSDSLAMSAGQLGGQLLSNAIVPGSGMVMMGATAFGSEAESALRNGADFDEAVLSSAISAGAEMLTEKIGGVKFGGKTLTDAAFGELSSRMTSKLARALVSTGKISADALAEGGEELLSGYLGAAGQKLTYMKDKEIEELFSNEDKLESFVGGVVLGGAFGGVETAISGRDAASGLTKHEQAVVDKVYNETIAQREANGKVLTSREKAKIHESVVEQMENGQIDIDTIESVLGGNTYKEYTKQVESEEKLKTELGDLRKMKASDMNDIQTSRMSELKGMNLDDTTKRDALRKKLDDTISPLLKDSKLSESYRERERRGQAFEADLSEYTGKQREAVERAIKSGVLNNTYRSHELVNVLSKLEADKGIVFDYTNNAKLKESGFAVEGKTVNGFANKNKGSVTLNVQSAKAWQSVVGHEITHVLEGTDAYSELQNALYAFAESKGELESRRASLTELYQNMDADIESELTADLVGDYLFTDKEFINNLTGNRTLFQKIYDEIKYLWNAATGKEKTEIEKVKAEFDKAWKEFSAKDAKESGDVQYSISEIVDENNKSYGTGVKLDSTLLENLSPEERVEMVKERVKELGGSTITAYDSNGNAVEVTIAESNKKFKNKSGKRVNVNQDLVGYNRNPVKQEAVVLVDELITTASFNGTEPATHPHDWVDNKGQNDWDVWETYIQDKENTVWKAKLRIANSTNGEKILYDVFPIEKVGEVETLDTTPTDDSISPLPENVNTQFSLSEPVEQTKDLMALHNLQSSELLKTLELGGLPMPSIAVIKDTMSHEEYGDVSLILPKEAIDPAANKDNKVYGGDAWTPTYPKIEYKPNEKVAKKIRDKYYGLAEIIGYDEVRPLYNYVNDLENTLNRDGGESSMLEKLYKDTMMMNVYLQDSGKGKVEPITRETVAKISDAEAEMNKFAVDALGEEFVASFKTPEGENPLLYRSAFVDQHDAEIREAYARYFKEVHGFSEEQANNVLAATTKSELMKHMMRAYKFTQNNGVTVKTETDYEATADAIREAASDGYREWVDGLFGGIEEKSGIRNNQDYYTRSGNPRSWDALHWENTLENVIKVMKGQGETGVGSFSPFNTLFGASHKKYGSIEDIKADSNRLGEINQDEYDTMKDSFSERFASIAESIKDPGERNPFIATDTAAEQIIEAVRTKKTKTGILNHLKKLNSRASMQTVDEVLSLVSDIANMPTGYFEAKPQRAVGLDEVGVFVIPNNVDVKIKQELLNRGYSIAEYDPNVEGDRKRVVNQFEEYKFSLSNVGEESAPVGDYSTPLKDLALEEDIAPVATDNNVGHTGTTAEAPFPNDIAPMTEEEANAIQDAKAKADAKAEGLPKSRKQLHNGIINDTKATFSSAGFDFDDVLSKAKDLSTFSTVDNTPQRVMEKALGYKEGQVLADLTVNKVAQNETKGIKWLNSFTDRKNGLLAQISKQYRIKPGSKESAAAQMYAEGFYVNDNNEIIEYGDAELAKDFPEKGVQYRIKGLAHDPRIRQIYDETLDAINASRARNAYPEIQRLENYFLHFRAMDDTFSRLGLPFNPNDIRAKDLPTDLNGVTADLKPGQPYFASAMHRTGKRTSFDLLGGLERYLTSAKNQIYHIDDIQTLRALRNYIADTYGQANGLEGIDALSEEEAQEKIKQVYDSHLSTFAKFLNEEANVLAGKTTLIDRGLEGAIGRRFMTFLTTVGKQTGSNMVGLNISSSLTNFLPVVQTFAKTNKFDFTKAFAQTVSNKISSVFGKGDGFTENSPVVIRRKGADRFYRTPWQKAGDAGYLLMSAVDDISTELIARTKFNELTRKGMDEQTAHFETDKWVSRLMGDRSLGQQPQLFNSKTFGELFKFQLEVRNQLDSQFYDTIQEAKVSAEDIENGLARNAKIAAKVTSTFVQLAFAQHLFGKAFESVAGYNPAFDIISVLATMFGFDDDEESEDTVLDNIEQGFFELWEDLPYVSTLTGGRIPMSAALPIAELYKGEDKYGNEKSRWETAKEALPYYVLPGGYGQIKKTYQGLNMFSDDHPVSGSYTDSGKLRFPVEDTPLNRVQAAIFGQYASENAREYFDNGYAPLEDKQIQEYIDVDIPIKDYWEYREGLNDIAPLPGNKTVTLNQKGDYVGSLDLPASKKNILINNIADDRKTPIDMTTYGNYKDFEEFDFAQRYPEKYAVLKDQGISVAEYKKNLEESTFLYTDDYSWAANNPDKYTLSKVISDDVTEYKRYTSELSNIEADKDSNGKSINGSRKEKVVDYINSLDIDDGAKKVLFKSQYSADNSYDVDIINYINSRSDLTYDEKVTILTEIGFRVEADGQIYTD